MQVALAIYMHFVKLRHGPQLRAGLQSALSLHPPKKNPWTGQSNPLNTEDVMTHVNI
jgi:hypothetical protein